MRMPTRMLLAPLVLATLLGLAALGLGIAGARDLRWCLEGGWRRRPGLAPFGFAGRLEGRVLGEQAAPCAGVIGGDQFVGVSPGQGVGGEDVDVIAGGRGVAEDGRVLALAGRDQVYAAPVEGAVGGAVENAGAGSGGLPLIDVEAARQALQGVAD